MSMSATPRDRCDRAPLVIDGGPSVIARPARLAEYLAQLPGLAARTAPPMSAAGQSQLEAALALLRSDDAKSAEADRTTGTRRIRKTPAGPASGAS